MKINKFNSLQILFCITGALLFIGCFYIGTRKPSIFYTDSINKNELVIYIPHFKTLHLVCGKMPTPDMNQGVFCVAAAFTGKCLSTFSHLNIAGDHVGDGKLFHGYPCQRNTGTFVFYKDHYLFEYNNTDSILKIAVQNGGMGFSQEMIIHKGKLVVTTRPDSNQNEFRALCDYQGKLVVIDSDGKCSFGKFKHNLLSIGVTEALYLDMGTGWNYSWYRDKYGDNHEIHSRKTPYSTNWIVFE